MLTNQARTYSLPLFFLPIFFLGLVMTPSTLRLFQRGMNISIIDFGPELETTWFHMEMLLFGRLRRRDTVKERKVVERDIRLRTEVYYRLYDSIFRCNHRQEIMAEIYGRVTGMVSTLIDDVVDEVKGKPYDRLAWATGRLHRMLRSLELELNAVMPNYDTNKHIYGELKPFGQAFQSLLYHALHGDLQISLSHTANDISRVLIDRDHNIENSLIVMYILRSTPPSQLDMECEAAYFKTITIPYSRKVEKWASRMNILQFVDLFDLLRTEHIKDAARYLPETVVRDLICTLDELTVDALAQAFMGSQSTLYEMFNNEDIEQMKFIYSKLCCIPQGLERFGDALTDAIQYCPFPPGEPEAGDACPVLTNTYTRSRIVIVNAFLKTVEVHMLESFKGNAILRKSMMSGIRNLVNRRGGKEPFLGQDRLATYANNVLSSVNSPIQEDRKLLNEVLHSIGEVSKCLEKKGPFIKNYMSHLSTRLLKSEKINMDAEESFYKVLLEAHGIQKVFQIEVLLKDLKKSNAIAASFTEFSRKRKSHRGDEHAYSTKKRSAREEPAIVFEVVEEDAWPDISNGAVGVVDPKKDTGGYSDFLKSRIFKQKQLKKVLFGTRVTIDTDVFGEDESTAEVRINMSELQFHIFDHVEQNEEVSYAQIIKYLERIFDTTPRHKEYVMERVSEEVRSLVFGDFKLLRSSSYSEKLKEDDVLRINHSFVPPSSYIVLPW